MTSSITSPSSAAQYDTALKALEKRLDEFELAMKLINYAYPHNLEGAKALINAAPPGLLLNFILTTYAYRTNAYERGCLIEGTNPYTDLFFEIWLLYDQTPSRLTIELNEDESLVPEKLLKKYEANCLHISLKGLRKLVNKTDRALLQKLFPRLSPADKALVLDQMEELPAELIPLEEVIDVVEALEERKSDKTVRFISSLPLNSFFELSKLRIPLSRILSRCFFIPDILRLKRMGVSKEYFLLHSVPYDENGRPFRDVLYKSLDSADIKSYPPILLIIGLNHSICLDPILPYLSKSTTYIYAKIPFIATFGSHIHVLSLYRYFKKLEDPTLVYSLLKALDIQRKENDDSLSLEDVSLLINKEVKNCFEQLSVYCSLLKKRDVKAFWSPQEIEKLEHFQYVLRRVSSIQFDALIAPFYQFRAKHLLTSDIAKVKRLCDEGEKLLPSLMQYEDKRAKGVISKGKNGKSSNRVPIIWKDEAKDEGRRRKAE